LTLMALHPGATAEGAREATSWDLRVAADLDMTEPPTEEELHILRDQHARIQAARKETAG
jgi:glutaconate CoA-transferase subunit B